MPRPWCWGAGVPDVVSLVGSLLQQHGVPNNAAANRAKLLVQSLGMESIKQAVQGASPWKTLKSLANQQTPPFQLVLPDELNLVAQDRKTKKQKSAKMPSNKIAPSKPMDIDPTKLSLAQDTFHMDSGQPAPQLPASQVGPLAVGVALVTIQEALPFLQSGQLLTAKSLALLVINGPDELPTKLSWTSIRFAACSSVNQQPVLLHGHLVQLGAQPIVPVFTKESPGVHDVPVTCARVTVFADQWPQDWSSLADHPFKQVLQVLLPLQTCRSEDCQCGRWHPDGMDGNQDVILDVFRRQFFTEAGRPTKHAQANHFSVQTRYLKSQELALLRLSGQNGVFIEPRIQDASSPSDEFQVVWLPQASFASAQHQLQCEPMGLGLARSGRRFGLRVAAKDFQALFQKLKPEGQFLSPGTRQTWHCGPFPFGSDRKSIGRVFAEWKWQARPLQPAKPIANGVMWLVQSVTDPPQTVYNMQHGQVMISKCDSVRAGMADNGTVIGPQSTIELCASNTAVDPWTVQDPWQQALNQVPIQQPAPMNSHIIWSWRIAWNVVSWKSCLWSAWRLTTLRTGFSLWSVNFSSWRINTRPLRAPCMSTIARIRHRSRPSRPRCSHKWKFNVLKWPTCSMTRCRSWRPSCRRKAGSNEKLVTAVTSPSLRRTIVSGHQGFCYGFSCSLVCFGVPNVALVRPKHQAQQPLTAHGPLGFVILLGYRGKAFCYPALTVMSSMQVRHTSQPRHVPCYFPA